MNDSNRGAGPYELDDPLDDGPLDPGGPALDPGPDPPLYEVGASSSEASPDSPSGSLYEVGATSPDDLVYEVGAASSDEPLRGPYEVGASSSEASPDAPSGGLYEVGATSTDPTEPGLDHYEIGDSPGAAADVPPPPDRSWVVPAVVLVVVALLGLGGWWWLREEPVEAPRTAEAPAADGTFDAPPAPARDEAPVADDPVEAPPIDLPPLNASDEAVRRLAEKLSAHPRLAAFLASDQLVRRFVGAVNSVAEGSSPKTHVPFLAPEGSYAVREARESSGPRAYASEAGYQRYDRAAAVVASLDARGTARLYRQLEPLMDEAYAELGYPDRSFEEVLARAMGRVLAVPASDEPVELRPGVVSYRYADPELEALPEAEKHLLRMGPANLRRVQAKVRELAAATGIRPVAPR